MGGFDPVEESRASASQRFGIPVFTEFDAMLERVEPDVVVIGTPLKFHHPLACLIPLVKYFRPLPRKRGGSDIRDAAARGRHPSYDRMPMKSVHELQRLQRRVRPRLARITAPILIAHGAHDRTANPADAATIRDSVSSEVREYILLASSAHIASVDVDGPDLASAVADFLLRHT